MVLIICPSGNSATQGHWKGPKVVFLYVWHSVLEKKEVS